MKLWLWCFLAFLWPSATLATTQVTFCNDSSVRIAYFKAEARNMGMFHKDYWTVSGWYPIKVGECATDYQGYKYKAYPNYTNKFYGFVISTGDQKYPFIPNTSRAYVPGIFSNTDASGIFKATDKILCVHPSQPFETDMDQLSNASGCSNGGVPMQAAFQFFPVGDGFDFDGEDIRLKINADSLLGHLSPETSLTPSVSAPTYPVRPTIPKPMSPGTINAKFQGKQVVMWDSATADEQPWYFADGTRARDIAVPTGRGKGFCDLCDRPDLSKEKQGLAPKELYLLIPPASVQVMDFIYNASGRAWVMTRNPDQTIHVKTFTFWLLDTSQMVFDPRDNTVEIPCKRGISCVQDFDSKDRTYAMIYNSNFGHSIIFHYIKDRVTFQKVRDLFDDLINRFTSPYRTISVDASCACKKYDGF